MLIKFLNVFDLKTISFFGQYDFTMVIGLVITIGYDGF